jgi:hypothetical protein
LSSISRLLGLAPFGGFDLDHFRFFEHPAERRSWEVQAEIKARLTGVWQLVRERLSEQETHLLGEIHAGQLGLNDTMAHAQTNWMESGVNLTVELIAEELQLNLVGWSADQAPALERWLTDDGRVRPFVSLADWELVAFRRRPANYASRTATSRPFWRRQLFTQVARLRLSELARRDLAQLKATWRQDSDDSWEKIGYHLRRAWPRDHVVALGPSLVAELADDVRLLLPISGEVNRGRTNLRMRDCANSGPPHRAR